jgi:drug/metabolite transporter (DMT)-like permease
MGLILFVGVLAMASASIFIRQAQAEGAPSLVIAAYRLLTATLVMSVPALSQRAWQDYAKLEKRELGMLLLSGLLLGLHFATWITSLAHTSVVSSVVLVTTTPLWIGLASPLVLGERTSRLTWAGIAAAMVGGSIVGLADWSGVASSTLWGDVLALTGAFMASGYLMIGRSVRAKLRLTSYLWLVYGTAAVFLLIWSIAADYPLTGYSPEAMGWMIALGLIPQMIGHTAANYAVRHLSATFVGVTILGEPIGSTILAILFLKEWPKPLQVLGGILILAGIALASTAEEHHTTQDAPNTVSLKAE